jgi:HSP20 family molecular chaperone IbpA
VVTETQTYDPFDELARIQDRIDRMVGGQFPEAGRDMPGLDARRQDSDIIVTVDMPGVDIRQQDSDVIVTVDMPGVVENDVRINVRDERILDILAQKNDGTGEEEADPSRRERRYMYYCRSLMLPLPVAMTKTTCDNGVFVLTLSAKLKAGEKGAEGQVA